jgi:hypothetical protein
MIQLTTSMQRLSGLFVWDFMIKLTQDRLMFFLTYNPDTGLFKWTNNAPFKMRGKEAGYYLNGYHRIQVDGVMYASHRLAWLYMTGKFPDNQIDHKDRNKSNNKWLNLRQASHTQNQLNKRSKNASIYRGVKEVKRLNSANRYVAYSMRKHIGTFDTAEDAALAYQIYVFKTVGDYLPI